MTVTATHNGEEILAEFTAETERSDYGVSGSPVWDEVDPASIEVAALTILGIEVKLTDLPDDLQQAIIDLADETEFA